MVSPDHDCHWTRRRETELTRVDGTLMGAGISRSVLEACAAQLGHRLTAAPDPESEDGDDETITVGPWTGGLHDGCFVVLDSDDDSLRSALIAATMELHAHYLGAGLPSRWTGRIAEQLAPGMVVRIHSIPPRGELVVRRHPHGASWLARRMAKVARYRIIDSGASTA